MRRTRHIGVKYFFVRELINYNVLAVFKIEGDRNPADIGTKPLGTIKFRRVAICILDGREFFMNMEMRDLPMTIVNEEYH